MAKETVDTPYRQTPSELLGSVTYENEADLLSPIEDGWEADSDLSEEPPYPSNQLKNRPQAR